jgi:hypothetical protein
VLRQGQKFSTKLSDHIAVCIGNVFTHVGYASHPVEKER